MGTEAFAEAIQAMLDENPVFPLQENKISYGSHGHKVEKIPQINLFRQVIPHFAHHFEEGMTKLEYQSHRTKVLPGNPFLIMDMWINEDAILRQGLLGGVMVQYNH